MILGRKRSFFSGIRRELGIVHKTAKTAFFTIKRVKFYQITSRLEGFIYENSMLSMKEKLKSYIHVYDFIKACFEGLGYKRV